MVDQATAQELGLAMGSPGIKSVGPLAFGPEGVLFVGDNVGASIFALDVGDAPAGSQSQTLDLEDLDTSLASYMGCSREDVQIRDMAVHPLSRNVFLSVMRGSGEAAVPVIVRIDLDGGITDVALDNIGFSKTNIEDAADEDDPREVTRVKLRTVTITDMSYVDGLLVVAGTSNEEFSSTLRRIPFPFSGDTSSNSLEIFHVSHGRYETAAPIRAFVPYQGNNSILASYTCTPVVQFSVSQFKPGELAHGKTVAELGAHNRPLDLVSYQHDDEEYLLVANDRHPLIKIACVDIDQQGALTVPDESLDNSPADPVTPGVGVPRQILPHPGVRRMANLGDDTVLMLQEDGEGHFHLHTYGVGEL
ncbi:MAG: hypothetical protein OXI91_08065 [Chloroflexota bacterium]|nr:hypothetical protein [Chloroflexota bacterium]